MSNDRTIDPRGAVITRDNALCLLTDLIAIPSPNPMGMSAWEHSEPVERGVIEYLETLFAPHVAAGQARLERHACAPIHESLFVRVPGADPDLPVLLLESHIDTVPAGDWGDRAFHPRIEGDVVFGRGACDDKGCLAAMVLAVLDLLASGEAPPQPILLMAAGDEENAQTGIRQFCTLDIPVSRAVFGEPTSLVPVVQHKGTLRWDITVPGKSAHTARPELGVNAILGMMTVIEALREHEKDLKRRFRNDLIGSGPALTVTKIAGGRTRNAVPDFCTIALDFRVLPGMDMERARREVIERIDALGLGTTHSDLQIRTPPLHTAPDDPFCRIVLDACRAESGREMVLAGVPYGTDASWVSDRAPAVVLGPGDIAYAHAIDERIDIREVVTSAHIYRRLLTPRA